MLSRRLALLGLALLLNACANNEPPQSLGAGTCFSGAYRTDACPEGYYARLWTLTMWHLDAAGKRRFLDCTNRAEMHEYNEGWAHLQCYIQAGVKT